MAIRKSTSAKTSTRKQTPTRRTSKGIAKITSDEIYHQGMQNGFHGDELSDRFQAEKGLNDVK